MDNISPSVFGRLFGEISVDYLNVPGKYISPVFHLVTLVLFVLILSRGNKHKRIFTFYFLMNYIWIFLYVGLYMSYLFYKGMGWSFLVFWGAIPFLLAFIVIQWLKELKARKNNLEFCNSVD